MSQDTGARIKKLRISKGISMAQLAKEVQVTRSLLSQVEKGQALPSLPTLGKIVEALGVSLSEFFSMDVTSEIREEDIIIRGDHRKMIPIPETKSRYQILTPHTNSKLEFFISEFPPNEEERGGVPSIHKGEEFFYVVSGTVSMRIGDNIYDIGPGDSGSFDSVVPHSFANHCNETAKVLFAIIRETSAK